MIRFSILIREGLLSFFTTDNDDNDTTTIMLSRARLSAGRGRGGGATMPTAPLIFPSPRSQLSTLARPLCLRRGRSLVMTRQQQQEGSYGGTTGAATTTTTTKTIEEASAPPTARATADAHAPASSSANADNDDPNAKLFDWRRCWYPVALVESLKTDRPNAVELLGEPLVVWKPLGGDGSSSGGGGGAAAGAASGGWVVQRDACPHRLAPLSEGRLETDGTLQCSYHGWRFTSAGDLALVPQLAGADPAAHARACGAGSGRGCVAVHPSLVVDGVLWAWAEAGGADVATRAATACPPSSLPPEMLPKSGADAAGADAAQGAPAPNAPWTANALGWYVRDVPLSMEMIVENFLDASHIPFSHHSVMGDRNAPDHTITMSKSAAAAVAARAGGLSVRVQPPGGRAAYGLSFVPPGLVRYDFGGVAMLLHVTPTSPGRSRIFLTVIEPPTAKKPLPPPQTLTPSHSLRQHLSRLAAFLDPRTLKNRWVPLYHATNRNAALDGDAFLLYKAQELLLRGGGGGGVAAGSSGGGSGPSPAATAAPVATTTTTATTPTTGHGVDWRRLYYMPSSADLAVAAWRRWLDGLGSAMPMLPANAAALGLPPPAPLSRLEVFDRYEQHTKHCPHCLRALALCNWGLGFLALAGLAAFTVAVWFAAAFTAAGAGGAAAGAKAAASAGVSALCAWAASALWRLRMLFIVYDYQHSEH